MVLPNASCLLAGYLPATTVLHILLIPNDYPLPVGQASLSVRPSIDFEMLRCIFFCFSYFDIDQLESL